MRAALRKAEEKDRLLIQNLFNLYQSDMGAFCDAFSVLDENGYFDASTANEILPFTENVMPYILEYERHPVGILLLTRAPYVLSGCAWQIQELFLIRAARGKGLAREAVLQALQGKSGRWGLSVYRRNAPARRFWEKLIAEIGKDVSVSEGENDMLDISFFTE